VVLAIFSLRMCTNGYLRAYGENSDTGIRFCDRDVCQHTDQAPLTRIIRTTHLCFSVMLHVPIHLWTTVESVGPVWPLCQATGAADRADRVTPGSGPLNLI